MFRNWRHARLIHISTDYMFDGKKTGAYDEESPVNPITSSGLLRRRGLAHPRQLHGPNYQWSHKIAGKTRTIRLSEEQARLCQEWIRNHKRLKRLLREMELLSLKETNRIIGAISRP